MKMGNVKTNAMRILDSKKIEYIVSTYDNKDGKIDGVSVAQKINKRGDKHEKDCISYINNPDDYLYGTGNHP